LHFVSLCTASAFSWARKLTGYRAMAEGSRQKSTTYDIPFKKDDLTLPEMAFQENRNLFGGLETKKDTLDPLPTPNIPMASKNEPQPALSPEIAAIMNGFQKVLQSISNNQSQAGKRDRLGEERRAEQREMERKIKDLRYSLPRLLFRTKVEGLFIHLDSPIITKDTQIRVARYTYIVSQRSSSPHILDNSG